MRIGIDASEANVIHRVGSNVYAYEVLLELEKHAIEDDVIVFLSSPPVSDLPKERKGWKYRVIGPKKMWTQWRLPLELLLCVLTGKKLDVFYSLGHYSPRFSPFKTVVTIMDLAFIEFPSFFLKRDAIKLTNWTRYSVKQASHVICISENTKKDVMKVYKKKASDITVAYPGFVKKKVPMSSQSLLRQMKIKTPYIVYVGTIQPRKNLVRAIKAFELVHKSAKHADLHFVIAGKTGWLEDEFTKTLQHSSARSHIHVVGFVTDEQKYALYTHAKASILVGLYEGFGIPPLESLTCGTLPIVSDNSSLPEVVGKAGVLVNPYDVNDIARAIIKVVEYTQEDKKAYLQYMKEQIMFFSWEKTGKIILDTLHKVGGSL